MSTTIQLPKVSPITELEKNKRTILKQLGVWLEKNRTVKVSQSFYLSDESNEFITLSLQDDFFVGEDTVKNESPEYLEKASKYNTLLNELIKMEQARCAAQDAAWLQVKNTLQPGEAATLLNNVATIVKEDKDRAAAAKKHSRLPLMERHVKRWQSFLPKSHPEYQA